MRKRRPSSRRNLPSVTIRVAQAGAPPSRRSSVDARWAVTVVLTLAELILEAGDERPNLGNIDFLDRYRNHSRLRQKCRQIEVGLEADVHGEWRNHPFDSSEELVRAPEVIQKDDAAATPTHAVHFAGHRDRIGND